MAGASCWGQSPGGGHWLFSPVEVGDGGARPGTDRVTPPHLGAVPGVPGYTCWLGAGVHLLLALNSHFFLRSMKLCAPWSCDNRATRACGARATHPGVHGPRGPPRGPLSCVLPTGACGTRGVVHARRVLDLSVSLPLDPRSPLCGGERRALEGRDARLHPRGCLIKAVGAGWGEHPCILLPARPPPQEGAAFRRCVPAGTLGLACPASIP